MTQTLYAHMNKIKIKKKKRKRNQGLTGLPRLALNLQSSGLSLQSARIIVCTTMPSFASLNK
jgi:hypothetical protein